MSDFRTIPLPNGRHTIVDAADYDWASGFCWFYHHKNTYARRAGGVSGRWIYLHREIMAPPSGLVVDHINRNKLDNRRCNLRVCTQAENTRNADYKRGASGLRGACRYKGGRWQAKVRVGGKQISLGIFDTALEAALAYDTAARAHYGAFAVPNFPEAAQ